ncbi:MAG: SPFH domain-containing protein [Thermoanaerobaculales bacterium]|nr:SPFH domain-containing protein [Thermoanaerobaculales bacterium]
MAETLEVLEHFDPTGEEIVYRFPLEGSANIKLGAQLVVQQSQEAVFFRDGRALDVFGPGRHTLATQNIPMLTKTLSLPFGGTSPFRVSVAFINKRTFLDQKWGTREPVVFRDSELGVVRLRAFGNYAYRIKESQLFINTVVGNQALFDTNRLKDFYRDVIVARLNDLLGETLKTIFDLASMYDEIATAAKARLAEDFNKYGVDLTDFYVNSITPPDEVQEKLDERAAMGAVGDMSTYMQFKAAQAIQDAAQAGGGEGGGAASAGMGLGLGAGFGAMMPGMITNAMQQAGQGGGAPTTPAAGATTAAAGAAAGTTAAETADGSFCTECGSAVPAGGKFCPNCGAKQAVPSGCSECGTEVPAGAKFCPECGAPQEE